MNIDVKGIKQNVKDITMSGSKSITIRALFCAFLAFDNSIIHHANISDDVLATINALKKLGANIKIKNDKIFVQKTVKIVQNEFDIDVKSSATLLRFIIPTFLVLYPNKILKIHMNDDLKRRPLDGYDAMNLTNHIKASFNDDYLSIQGEITKDLIEINNEKSSQYVSGLLLALPLLKRKITLKFDTTQSNSYINMTLKVRESFGIKNSLEIDGNMSYIGRDYVVEGDYSNAALLIALSLNREETTINNLKRNSLQGDEKILEYLVDANAKIIQNETSVTIIKSQLSSFNLNIDNNIDLGPILFALATICKDKSTFSGIKRLEYKESNRLKEMLKVFDNLSVKYELKEDLITIYPCKFEVRNSLEISKDHRILQALILLSLFNQDLEIGDVLNLKKSDKYLFTKIQELLNVDIVSKPKLLISVNRESDLSLPADGYVLGYEKFTLFASNYFSYREVKRFAKKKPIYLLLNALIHEHELNRFKKEIDKLIKLPINFIVQDIGALHYLENKISSNRIIYYPYTLICQQDELMAYAINSNATIGVSNEITLSDTYQTLKSNRGFLTIFGYIPMYQSYRKLLSLYEEYRAINLNNKNLLLKEDTRNEFYHISENKNGTVIFRPYVLSYLENISYVMHAKYVYLDQLFIKNAIFKKIVKISNDVLNNRISEDDVKYKLRQLPLHFEDGFKYQDSIYKEKTL